MIRATSSIDGPPLIINATVSGPVVYLDNWAIGDLAEENPSRRKRFIDAMRSGVDLLFSVTNAAELAGPQGKSFDLVKSFLNEVGPNWFPVELDPFVVVKREQSGADPAESCISEDFMKAYFADRTASYSPDSGKIIDLSDTFFGLGAVLDWVAPRVTQFASGQRSLITSSRRRFVRNAPNTNEIRCQHCHSTLPGVQPSRRLTW